MFELALLKQSNTYIFHELTDKCSAGLTGELVIKISELLATGARVIYTSHAYLNMGLNIDRYINVTREGNLYECTEISD